MTTELAMLNHAKRLPLARVLLTVLPLATLLLSPAMPTASAQGFKITLERPGPRDFIVDKAELISTADEAKIKALCDKLLTEKATPIIVVTIPSMAEFGGAGMRIETFATLLFNQWEIGQEKLNGQLWNTGILLLVSKNDRKARIELGGYWRHDQDRLAEQILSKQIVPRFKQGDYSGGITAGVESLDKMARGLAMPASSAPTSQASGWMSYLLIGGAIALAVFTAISLSRSGSSGWAWLMWGALFAGLGYLLYQMFNQQGGSRSGGGGWSGGSFSGGSFGGGFSGGGGATGSW